MNRFGEDSNLTIQKLILERIKQRFSQQVSQTLLNSLKYGERKSEFDTVLIKELEWQWFGIRRKVNEEIKYPKDWWEALKERFFPKWLLRRFPVEYTKVGVKDRKSTV